MAVWPNGTKSKPYTSDGFGWRERHPITGARTFHYGWDSYGYTYNCAPEAGVVIFAQYNGTAGNHIQIRTPAGVVYGTMHNARILVSVGQEVAEGEALGVQGTTGGSTGVHNHQEVLINGLYTDPVPFIESRLTSTAGTGGAVAPQPRSEERSMFIKVDGPTFRNIPAGWMFEMADDGKLRPLSEQERGLVEQRAKAGLLIISDWKASDIYNHELKSGMWEFTGEVTGSDPGWYTGYLLFGMPREGDNMKRLPGQPYPKQ